MQVILLHPRLAQAKSITLTKKHLLLAMLVFLTAVAVGAVLLQALTLRFATGITSPFLLGLIAQSETDQASRQDKFLKQNLAFMAVRLGQMQAQLVRLDALGERVQGLAGVKPEDFNFKALPGRGGAAPSSLERQAGPDLSLTDFQKLLDAMTTDVEHRADYMNVLESTLMADKIQSKLLPTNQPVKVNYVASGFGVRFDPFTGHSTFHAGIDFPAPTGTPIVAAAGGVVIASEFHNDYGNMLEIDHGNDIVTRYAHASRLLVHIGDIVKRGQHVADIGSTGRSTGAHLHFEVRVKGVAQDPNKFLAAGADLAKVVALR
ncbi:MAG: M23 family metallopeptidase [Glaciimonas sp.]|nr:M23 family metallopeptidase [Glaciimonas sp.]